MLVLQPCGGLCNRLQAIASAYALSLKLQKPLHIIWEKYPLLDCDFHLLFKKNQSFSIANTSQPHWLFRQFKKLANNVQYESFIYLKKFEHLVLNQYDFTQLDKYNSTYIVGYNKFYPFEDYNIFQPLPKLQKKMNELLSNTENIIGLHIRRTDHIHAIQYSQTNSFINIVKKELSLNPKVKFFLATDDPKEEQLFKNLFPQKIIINSNKDFNRSSIKGIQDAVVDLYTLAATQKIYGSYQSTFSETAAEIRQIPLEIITSSS